MGKKRQAIGENNDGGAINLGVSYSVRGRMTKQCLFCTPEGC